MTTASLSTDIALAERAFHAANRQHWNVRVMRGGGTVREYQPLHWTVERRIGQLADRLATLRRLHGWLVARELLDRQRALSNGEHVKAGCK